MRWPTVKATTITALAQSRKAGDDGNMDDLVAHELKAIREDINEIKHTVRNVQQTQTSSIERFVRMEERQNAYEKANVMTMELMKDHESRLKTIEVEQPMTKMVRGWVISMVIAVVAATAGGVYFVAKITDRPLQVVVPKE